DQVLAAFALAAHDSGDLPGDLVVATVMSNLGLRVCLEEAGVLLEQARVGDRYVLEEMLRTGAVLGGEQSGHVIFLRHATTGDGLLTSLKLAHLVASGGRKLAELASCWKRLPQVLRNVRVHERVDLATFPGTAELLRSAEERMRGRGRLLV